MVSNATGGNMSSPFGGGSGAGALLPSHHDLHSPVVHHLPRQHQNKIDEEHHEANEQCVLLGKFGSLGWWLQVLLLVVCFVSLIYKRFTDPVRRSWTIWFLDTSKQGVAACVVHGLNIALSKLFAFLSTTPNSDACNWYWLNLMLDCTLGVLVTFLCLRILCRVYTSVRLALYCPTKVANFTYRPELARIGDYGDPIDYKIYKRQLLDYQLIIIFSKIVVLIFVQVFSDVLLSISGFILGIFTPYPRAKLVFVMVICPIVMSCLALWVTDNFLQFYNDSFGDVVREEQELAENELKVDEMGGVQLDTTMHGSSRSTPEGRGGPPHGRGLARGAGGVVQHHAMDDFVGIGAASASSSGRPSRPLTPQKQKVLDIHQADHLHGFISPAGDQFVYQDNDVSIEDADDDLSSPDYRTTARSNRNGTTGKKTSASSSTTSSRLYNQIARRKSDRDLTLNVKPRQNAANSFAANVIGGARTMLGGGGGRNNDNRATSSTSAAATSSSLALGVAGRDVAVANMVAATPGGGASSSSSTSISSKKAGTSTKTGRQAASATSSSSGLKASSSGSVLMDHVVVDGHIEDEEEDQPQLAVETQLYNSKTTSSSGESRIIGRGVVSTSAAVKTSAAVAGPASGLLVQHGGYQHFQSEEEDLRAGTSTSTARTTTGVD
ncbi:unnamed protein product [Amoebophrya sp. A120]|nr:unnamed protein product [Amoebophrya sp. A120]|eukprot:GSA120T00022288001.1